MSNPADSVKDFLERWSQRKRAAERRAAENTEPPSRERIDGAAPLAAATADPLAFDPVTLPPIESITGTSDIRAFLAPGVPEELARAALRRVWVADPTIRDFVGLAENQWDFTNPDSVPGFGSLELTPALRRMLADLIGDRSGQIEPQRAASAVQGRKASEMSSELPPPSGVQTKNDAGEREQAQGDLFMSKEAAPKGFANRNPTRQGGSADPAPQQSTPGLDGTLPSVRRQHGSAIPE
jgi:hypothetical protein